ncbi:uncharacterized protein LOC108672459 [Hyalella azteca]|uniref:Uncharacterized protein LOC108672459 n=1 Tax=Hyalella azteca TaxID=294128 RepID=A0A8B7NPK1_HYAAZ|nr:uncharacterized protein LOC108672459 [Hyalella azteca]XP_047738754.1 uncharacterized protein LOC108672459 [Hyalella azteca]
MTMKLSSSWQTADGFIIDNGFQVCTDVPAALPDLLLEEKSFVLMPDDKTASPCSLVLQCGDAAAVSSVTLVSESRLVEVFIGDYGEYYTSIKSSIMEKFHDSIICRTDIKLEKPCTKVKLLLKNNYDDTSVMIYGVFAQVQEVSSGNAHQNSAGRFSSRQLSSLVAERNLHLSDKALSLKKLVELYNDNLENNSATSLSSFIPLMGMGLSLGRAPDNGCSQVAGQSIKSVPNVKWNCKETSNENLHDAARGNNNHMHSNNSHSIFGSERQSRLISNGNTDNKENVITAVDGLKNLNKDDLLEMFSQNLNFKNLVGMKVPSPGAGHVKFNKDFASAEDRCSQLMGVNNSTMKLEQLDVVNGVLVSESGRDASFSTSMKAPFVSSEIAVSSPTTTNNIALPTGSQVSVVSSNSSSYQCPVTVSSVPHTNTSPAVTANKENTRAACEQSSLAAHKGPSEGIPLSESAAATFAPAVCGCGRLQQIINERLDKLESRLEDLFETKLQNFVDARLSSFEARLEQIVAEKLRPSADPEIILGHDS